MLYYILFYLVISIVTATSKSPNYTSLPQTNMDKLLNHINDSIEKIQIFILKYYDNFDSFDVGNLKINIESINSLLLIPIRLFIVLSLIIIGIYSIFNFIKALYYLFMASIFLLICCFLIFFFNNNLVTNI